MRIHRMLLLALTIAAIAALSGCGGGGGEQLAPGGALNISVIFPVQPAEVAPQDLPVATNSVRIQVYTLNPPADPELYWETVIARDGTDPVQVTKQNVPVGTYLVQVFAYTSSDGTGQVIASAQTQVRVTAGQTAQINLITEALVVRVVISPKPATLEFGATATIAATAYDADDNIIVGANFNWSLSASGIVQLSGAGLVTPVGVGQCIITATEISSSLFDNFTIDIFRRPVAYVTVVPGSADLYPPSISTVQLTGTAYDALNQPVPYAVLVWSSDDPTVATVDATGLVTSAVVIPPNGSAKPVVGGPGRAIITADAGEGTPGTSEVTVTPAGMIDVTVQSTD